MQKIQNADFQTNEKVKEKENTLSKSADTFSTRELILNLNDSFIARKSREYNFDFNKASSYDTNLSYSGFLRGKQENLFQSHLAAEEPKEVKLTGRKTSCHVNFISEERLENNSYVCSKGICNKNLDDLAYKINGLSTNVVSKSANLESNKGKGIFAKSLSDFNDVSTFVNSDENNEYLKNNSSSNYFCNQNKEANKESGFRSQHNISNITRKTSSDAFKKLKERMQILQQQKKNFVEFFETKNQKEENDCENDNPNVYFE